MNMDPIMDKAMFLHAYDIVLTRCFSSYWGILSAWSKTVWRAW